MLAVLFLFFALVTSSTHPKALQTNVQPNIVIILVDDLGIGDLPLPGYDWANTSTSKNFNIPNIKELAAEGTTFTSWYTGASICTPSRTALLTGRLPVRAGMTDKVIEVFISAAQQGGLQAHHITIAEALKDGGYVTGMAGKWHLGVSDFNENAPLSEQRADGRYLPNKQGFDWSSLVAVLGNYGVCATANTNPSNDREQANADYCFLMEDGDVSQRPWKIDDNFRMVDKMAYDFERFVTTKNANALEGRPYFWFHSFLHVHTPFFTSAPFKGKHCDNAFREVVEEMDFGVGELMRRIGSRPDASKTVVFFLSDNGAFLEDFVHHNTDQSSNGPFKGGKGQVYEGGFRVPAIVWGPGLNVPAGVVTDSIASSMDIFPTVAKIAGLSHIPSHYTFDGKDLAPLLKAPTDKTKSGWWNEIYPFYCGQDLQAVRYNDHKIYYRSQNWVQPNGTATPPNVCHGQCCPGGEGETGTCNCGYIYAHVDEFGNDVVGFGPRILQHNPPLMYNVVTDRSERTPVASTSSEYTTTMAVVTPEVDAHKNDMSASCKDATQLRPPTYIPPLQPFCRKDTLHGTEFDFHLENWTQQSAHRCSYDCEGDVGESGHDIEVGNDCNYLENGRYPTSWPDPNPALYPASNPCPEDLPV